jgi:hypothetical protein
MEEKRRWRKGGMEGVENEGVVGGRVGKGKRVGGR